MSIRIRIASTTVCVLLLPGCGDGSSDSGGAAIEADRPDWQVCVEASTWAKKILKVDINPGTALNQADQARMSELAQDAAAYAEEIDDPAAKAGFLEAADQFERASQDLDTSDIQALEDLMFGSIAFTDPCKRVIRNS